MQCIQQNLALPLTDEEYGLNVVLSIKVGDNSCAAHQYDLSPSKTTTVPVDFWLEKPCETRC